MFQIKIALLVLIGLVITPISWAKRPNIEVENKIDKSWVTAFGLEVGRSTFADAKKYFGESYVSHFGEAGTSVYSVCYECKDGLRLVLESSEMGGEDRVVTSLIVEELTSDKKEKGNCTKISSGLRAQNADNEN